MPACPMVRDLHHKMKPAIETRQRGRTIFTATSVTDIPLVYVVVRGRRMALAHLGAVTLHPQWLSAPSHSMGSVALLPRVSAWP